MKIRTLIAAPAAGKAGQFLYFAILRTHRRFVFRIFARLFPLLRLVHSIRAACRSRAPRSSSWPRSAGTHHLENPPCLDVAQGLAK
jgi:hypothetical protein